MIAEGRFADTTGALGGFVIRPFGAAPADLGVDLSERIGPDVVTEILGRCLSDETGRPAPSKELWNAPVGDRIAGLVRIAAHDVDGTFTVPLRCPDPVCREPIEIELTWDEIRGIAERSAARPFAVTGNGRDFVVRRPTGADQERWRLGGLGAGTEEQADAAGNDPVHAAYEGAAAAAIDRVIVSDLIVEGCPERLAVADVATIQAALEAHDPLICCEVAVVCPTCGASASHEVSLTAVAIAVLRGTQARTLDEIHDLARAYGWAEGAILAIPTWRRARYRALAAADR